MYVIYCINFDNYCFKNVGGDSILWKIPDKKKFYQNTYRFSAVAASFLRFCQNKKNRHLICKISNNFYKRLFLIWWLFLMPDFCIFFKKGLKRGPKKNFWVKKNPSNLQKNFLGKVINFQVGLVWRFFEKKQKTVRGGDFCPPPRGL